MKRLMMVVFASLMIVAGTHSYGERQQSNETQTYYQCLAQFHMINYKDTVNCLFNEPVGDHEDLIGAHEDCFKKHIEAVNNLFNGCKVLLD